MVEHPVKNIVVYIDYNFIQDRYPNNPEDGNPFFTYGFGAFYSREFKKYQPDWNVECWKADSRIQKYLEKSIDGVLFRIFPSVRVKKLGHYSRAMIKFFQHYSEKNQNVVYNISSFSHLLFYSLARKMKNVPLVIQNHGEATAIHKTTHGNILKKLFWHLRMPLEKAAFRNIDLLYVLDKKLIDYLPQSFKGKAKQQGTGVDEQIFFPIDKEDAKKELGLSADKNYLLYVGRLNYTKRPDILIDVFNELKAERDDLCLILVGNEKTDLFYEKAINSGALVKGLILQTELYKFLSAASIYFLPKLSNDHALGGIGMLPVQAMLCNTPVIGDTLRNFPEQGIEKVGIVANDHETIKKAILDVIDKKVVFDSTRELAVKYYSWYSISRETSEDYYKLLKK
jgi:glycosyltransferase involved in cell wall biosynthesis